MSVGANGLLATDGDAAGKLGILSAKPRLRGLADSVTLSAWFVAWVFFYFFEARVAWDAIFARWPIVIRWDEIRGIAAWDSSWDAGRRKGIPRAAGPGRVHRVVDLFRSSSLIRGVV